MRSGWKSIAIAALAALAGSLAWSAVSAFPGETPAPLPLLHAVGTAIADEQNQPVILRGCNLGNWLLIEPWMLGVFDHANLRDQSQLETVLTHRFGAQEKDHILDLYRANWINERDFKILKSWNFNVVRLPFDCGLLEDATHPGELKPDAFRWLDRAVSLATASGIYVILDLHGAPGGQSLDGVTGEAGRDRFWTPENRRRGAFIWQKIAEHFRDSSTVAAYDLLNEPYGRMGSDNDDAELVGAMDEMIHAIRQVDERHLIFCAGSLRGIEMYGSPQARGWKNVGFTEHFYPGVYGGTSTLETHARFIGSNLGGRAHLLTAWNAPYFAGEFNVVFDHAGGADMMRRYYDVFQSHGWAATLWSYKLIKPAGGVQPDHWYMVTNGTPINLADFVSGTAAQTEAFCCSLGTMPYAQAKDLREALTAKTPASLLLSKYSPLLLPEQRATLPGWTDTDISSAFPKGGHLVAGDVAQVFGGGRDIYQGSDEFHFVSRPVSGDFSIQADVTPPAATNVHAKSGLMFRASLAPNAPFVMINLFPDGSCVAAYRTQPGKRISVEQLRFDPGALTLRIVRRASTFEVSAAGADGVELASKSFVLANLPSAGQAGMFVLSHDTMQLSEAKFSHLKFETSAGPDKTTIPSS
jgi:endoglucanase